ncbi:lymphocyte antigen 86 precursor [Camelus ferus]|nr:lymphocyte antigen 86 precursor [Camelus ferus]
MPDAGHRSRPGPGSTDHIGGLRRRAPGGGKHVEAGLRSRLPRLGPGFSPGRRGDLARTHGLQGRELGSALPELRPVAGVEVFPAAVCSCCLAANSGEGRMFQPRAGFLEQLPGAALCYPLQDFGFSADQCSKQLKPNLNIRFGIVLREDIEELFLDVALFAKGSSILKFSYPVCEVDLPKFSFCGRKKGGKVSVWLLRAKAQRDVDQSSRLSITVHFSAPYWLFSEPGKTAEQGEYQVLLELYNRDHSTVACANATVTCS